MKLKLIKDNEVVVSKKECELLYSIRSSVRNQTVAFHVFEYDDCVDVMLNCGCGFIPIKRFESDDPDYNRVCAEELVELLNQEQ
mgnify:CR=1 FL=1